jgi:hypothetical protein
MSGNIAVMHPFSKIVWVLLVFATGCVPPGASPLHDSGVSQNGDAGEGDNGADGGPLQDSGVGDDGGPDSQGQDGGPATSNDAGLCMPELPYDTPDLALTFFGGPQLQPGQSHDFDVLQVQCCYVPISVDMCETWSLTPEDDGATIDENGLLSVLNSAENGDVFLVEATLGDGRSISQAVHIYTEAGNPLVGTFSEAAQLSCADESELAPEQSIGELRFLADGSFNVTWIPFEVYVDYWGIYEHDVGTGALSLFTTGGNFIPDDVDGEGTFEVDPQGHLLLKDMWLGTPQGGSNTPNCGHRFQ